MGGLAACALTERDALLIGLVLGANFGTTSAVVEPRSARVMRDGIFMVEVTNDKQWQKYDS